jgi:hypothetical protein
MLVATGARTHRHNQFVIRYADLPRRGPEPDGDMVKFLPDTPALVETLPRPSGRPPDINGRGSPSGWRPSTRWRPTSPRPTSTTGSPLTAGDVLIMAVLPDPAGVDRGHEQLTLLNTTPTAIDLTGWSLHDRAGRMQNLTGGLPGCAVTQITMAGAI